MPITKRITPTYAGLTNSDTSNLCFPDIIAANGRIDVRDANSYQFEPCLFFSLLSPFQAPNRWCAMRARLAVAEKEEPNHMVCAMHHSTCPVNCGCRVILIMPVS